MYLKGTLSRPVLCGLVGILAILFSGSLVAQGILSLSEARQMAVDYDQFVRSAKEDVQASADRVKEAKTRFYPVLDFEGDYLYLNYPRTIRGEMTGTGEDVEIQVRDNASIGTNLYQPFYMGNTIKNNYLLSQLGETASIQQREIVTADIILETDLRYWRVVSRNERLNLARENLLLYEELVNNIQDRFEQGVANRNELLQAQVRLNDAELRLLQATDDLAIARMQLNQIIGRDVTESTQVVDSVTFDPINLDASTIFERAYSQREELQLRETDILAENTTLDLIKGEYGPQFGGALSTYVRHPNQFVETEFQFMWDASLRLLFPIVHWGEKKYRVSAQNHQIEISKLMRDKEKDLVTLEVQENYYLTTEAIRRVELTRLSLIQATENLRLSGDSYRVGVVTILDYLQAQASWQEAYSQYIDSKLLYEYSESRFLRSVGELDLNSN